MCRVPAHLDNILHRRLLDHAANFRNLCAETSNGRQMCDCVGGVRVSVTSGSLHRTEIWQDTRRRIQFFFLSKSPLDSLEFPKINQTLHSWRQIQIFTLWNFRSRRSSHWIYFLKKYLFNSTTHRTRKYWNEFRTIFGLKRNTLRCSTPAEVTQAVRSLRSSRVNWRATWPVTRVLKVPQRISSSQQEKKAPSGHGAQRSSTYRTLQLKQFVFFTLSVKRCDWLVNWLNQ